MGAILQVTCTGCGLDEQHLVGVGFGGVEHRVLACPSCRALTEQTWTWVDGVPGPTPECPTCHGAAEEVHPRRGGAPRSQHRGRVAELIERVRESQRAEQPDPASGAEADPPIELATPCPRCGEELTVAQCGLWD